MYEKKIMWDLISVFKIIKLNEAHNAYHTYNYIIIQWIIYIEITFTQFYDVISSGCTTSRMGEGQSSISELERIELNKTEVKPPGAPRI